MWEWSHEDSLNECSGHLMWGSLSTRERKLLGWSTNTEWTGTCKTYSVPVCEHECVELIWDNKL